jgi:signal transduction histidine kinase
MKLFSKCSIKLKIIILLLFVSFITLMTSSALFIYNDLRGFKENLLHSLTALAGTVGSNSRAAIYFKDEAKATEILSSLKEDSQIKYAALFDSKGDIFATYSGKGIKTELSKGKEIVTFSLEEEGVELIQPIFLKEKKIGEIKISADLEKYNSVIKKYFFIVGIILISTFGLAIILSLLLQKFLSNPIQNLAKVIKEISNKNDFSIRVTHQYKDEIGDLYFGFNQMISKIQKRDEELNSINTLLSKEIEQRKLAEGNLKFSSSELKRSNKELQEFATIASHDLQEPLRKIITFGDRIVKEFPEGSEKGKDYITRMQNASERMKRFISDLLEYSKIEAKSNPFEKSDLNDIFLEVLENLEIQISQSKAQISSDKLPTLKVDSFQIQHLFQNLIGNAVKYKKANDHPIIHVSARSIEHDFWEFIVKDNGIGFDNKYLERIFKPFERLHGKSEFEGSGMGLTICRKIVTRHGGSITASGILGEGSTFKFTLPELQGQNKNVLTLPLKSVQR